MTMVRAMMAGLLAGAMLVPTMAAAQVSLNEAMRQRVQARVAAQGGERAPGGGGWQRPDRGGPSGDNGGWRRPEGAGQTQRQDGGNWQRPDRGNGPGDRSGWRRPDAGGQQQNAGNWQRPAPARPPAQGTDRGNAAQRPAWNGRPGWGWNGGTPPRDWARARADRRDFNRDRAGFYDRQDWANSRGWYDRGGADRGWDGRGWNDRGWNGAGVWNRGWRSEPRYDWGRYRASNRSAYHLPRYYAPYGWGGGYRRFAIGVTLSSVLFAQDYWIDEPWSYRLPEAYGPYRWVRYYNDALLVDLETGQVVDTIYDIFW